MQFPTIISILEGSEKRNFKSPVGSEKKVVFTQIVNELGEHVLVKESEFSLYDKIQSHAEECDINKIIEKYNMLGDPNILYQRPGVYGDFSNMPTTYQEFFNKKLEAEKLFNNLAPDIKSQFVSVEDFIMNSSKINVSDPVNDEVPEVKEEIKNDSKE